MMTESIEIQLKRSVEAARDLYHRLVLVVGPSGAGKTALMRTLAKRYATAPVNINRHLSKALLELTPKQRRLKLSALLARVVTDTDGVVFLDNIEILFDVGLEQDPLRLLQRLARNLTVVASWNGAFDTRKLTYAEPGHREYRCYDVSDTLVVNMAGVSTIDCNLSSEEKQA